MKSCARCAHTLPLTSFDAADYCPDGVLPYCKSCAAREPWLLRSTCRKCGSTRRLSKFPEGDTSKPCTLCESDGGTLPADEVRALLAGADLVPGSAITATELLLDLGVASPNRADSRTAANWLQEQGYERSRVGASRLFAVGVRGREFGDGSPLQILSEVKLSHSGANTVSMLFERLGIERYSKGDLNQAAKWLRRQGFTYTHREGVRMFKCEPGETADNGFADWLASNPKGADALGLSEAVREAYLKGAPLPVTVRFAMSAIAAGMPPWGA